jgi:hypothetical protein
MNIQKDKNSETKKISTIDIDIGDNFDLDKELDEFSIDEVIKKPNKEPQLVFEPKDSTPKRPKLIPDIDMLNNPLKTGSDTESIRSKSSKDEIKIEDDYELPDNLDFPEMVPDDDYKDTSSIVSKQPSVRSHREEKPKTYEQIQNEKFRLIARYNRLCRQMKIEPRKFTAASNIEDIRMEIKRLKEEKNIDSTIEICRNGLIILANGMEMGTKALNYPLGIDLDDFANNQTEYSQDGYYDDEFEELYDKYGENIITYFGPELRLATKFFGAAIMYSHIRKITQEFTPKQKEVFSQNPELFKDYVNASTKMATENMKKNPNNFPKEELPQRKKGNRPVDINL